MVNTRKTKPNGSKCRVRSSYRKFGKNTKLIPCRSTMLNGIKSHLISSETIIFPKQNIVKVLRDWKIQSLLHGDKIGIIKSADNKNG